MDIYLRKSIKLGPIRFNLSKSGVGASAGVKGLRYGVRPDGRQYVHAGRHGVYYRKELGRLGQSKRPSTQTGHSGQTSAPYATAAATQLYKTLQGQLAGLLNSSLKAVRFDYAIALLALGAASWAFLLGVGAGLIATTVGVLVTFVAVRWEVARRAIFLQYNLDSADQSLFQQLVHGFNQLAACEGVWALTSSRHIANMLLWKRHAGASELVDRTRAATGEGTPRWVETNISLPVIHARGQALYFLPNEVLVQDATGFALVNYPDLIVSSDSIQFIEEHAPSDAIIVGHTWLHPNKDGGPDRRFAHNYQVPICRYGRVTLKSASGLCLHLHTSRHNAATAFESALHQFVEAHRSSSSVGEQGHRFKPSVEVNQEYLQSPFNALMSGPEWAGACALRGARLYDAALRGLVGEGNDLLHHFFGVLSLIAMGTLLVYLCCKLASLASG